MKNKYTKIELVDGEVSIKNKPLCTEKQIKKSKEIIQENLPKLLSTIPDGNPWKERKEKHMEMTKKETHEILQKHFQDKIVKENIELADFISKMHDLGRYLQAQKIAGVFKDYDYKDFENHGVAGVNLLKKWSALDPFSQKVQEIIKYAIGHHSEKNTTPLPDNSSDIEKNKFFYLCLVRDFDKYDGFCRKADNYLFDEATKEKQIEAQPHINGEKGEIKPNSLIDNFEKQETLDKNKVQSYEGFILQFFAWIFDMNLKVVLEKTCNSNASDKIFRYFENHIPESQLKRIQNTYNSFINKHNL